MSDEQYQNLKSTYPALQLLKGVETNELTNYLNEKAWLPQETKLLSISSAGEGNMNLVLRATTDTGSLIVKQAYPWVHRYPSIAAPWERAAVEAAFYQCLRAHPELAASMPELYGYDPESQILCLEDLGTATDFLYLYSSEQTLDQLTLKSLCDYLSSLHSLNWTEAPEILQNRAMRELNHEYIFKLPLEAPLLDETWQKTPSLVEQLRNDKEYCEELFQLGVIYTCSNTETLLHGDFYPGSWVQTKAGMRIIDPEFAFLGPAEFDLGVFAAHLMLSNHTDEITSVLKELYKAPANFDWKLADRFCAAEIMRRLIGTAKLPHSHSEDRVNQLLEASHKLMLN